MKKYKTKNILETSHTVRTVSQSIFFAEKLFLCIGRYYEPINRFYVELNVEYDDSKHFNYQFINLAMHGKNVNISWL